MLRSIFNASARPSYWPEKPVVLVNTAGDDCNRGDSHAYMGIAKIVTQKLGGEYHLVTNDTLNTNYPGIAHAEATNFYYRDHGVPDIIFSRMHYLYYDPDVIGAGAKIKPYVITGINEDLSRRTRFSAMLVAHHLTPTLLASEGTKLVDAYPEIKSPLVTVMMADSDYYGLAQNLIPRMKDMPEATIFVCTGRRTDSSTLNVVLGSLETELDKAGRSDDINILHYDFHANRNTGAFNPYIGLIDRSDHIVVCGDSYSIISETLSKQQAVYMNRLNTYFTDYLPLAKRGMVIDFNESSRDQPLIKTPVRVPNPTEKTANRVISGFNFHRCCQMGVLRGMLAYTTGF